ncbi:MAG: Vitamin B12 dependent methionine synthase, activation domain protein, partial [Tissierellia bacterium]|nr:Vitamin B12 dependent methionine synthase, activation domain protein [Tissierellia bacterium]
MKVVYLNKDKVEINKEESLRYMGYKSKNVDIETEKLLEEAIAELKDLAELKYVYRIFGIKKDNNNISFENMINIKSSDLNELFKNCDKSAVMAATLGFEVEKKIRYYSLTNLSKAVVFDACAASYIE